MNELLQAFVDAARRALAKAAAAMRRLTKVLLDYFGVTAAGVAREWIKDWDKARRFFQTHPSLIDLDRFLDELYAW